MTDERLKEFIKEQGFLGLKNKYDVTLTEELVLLAKKEGRLLITGRQFILNSRHDAGRFVYEVATILLDSSGEK